MKQRFGVHGRPVSKVLVLELSAHTRAVVQTREDIWPYTTPQVEAETTAVSIGTNSSCMLMCEGQWRDAMTGSISPYDRCSERLHSIYVAAAPDDGKALP